LAGYLLFFPTNPVPEVLWTPQWALPLSGAPLSGSFEGEIFAFAAAPRESPAGREGGIAGTVSSRGELIYTEALDYRLASGPRGFVNYSAAGGTLLLRDLEGRPAGVLPGNGYPYLAGDWVLVISRDRRGLSRWTWEGEKLWDYQFSSLITALDVNAAPRSPGPPAEGGILAGLLNGEAVCLDSRGRVVFSETAPGQVVYGAALGKDLRVFALVLGLKPQRLRVYAFPESPGGGVRLLWEEALDREYRTSRGLFFIRRDQELAVSDPAGAVIYGLKTRRGETLPLGYPLAEAVSPPQGQTLFFSRGEAGGELLFWDPQSGGNPRRLALDSSGAPAAYDGDRLILSQGGTLYSFSRRRKDL
jgi:hypothetical protein